MLAGIASDDHVCVRLARSGVTPSSACADSWSTQLARAMGVMISSFILNIWAMTYNLYMTPIYSEKSENCPAEFANCGDCNIYPCLIDDGPAYIKDLRKFEVFDVPPLDYSTKPLEYIWTPNGLIKV
jgi:hypothetical protein